MLQTSSFNQMHVLVASNSITLFFLEEENILNYFIQSIASSCCVVAACIEDTPVEDTLVHTLTNDNYSLALWVSRKLRPEKQNNSVFAADCFNHLVYCLSIKCPISALSGSDSRFVL